MDKYKQLIFGGLLTLAAIAVIIWIMRENQDVVNNAVSSTSVSPDEEGVETLNGLSPNNAQVEVAGSHLTCNVPQPGNIAPVSSNADYLTSGQATLSGIDTADWTIENLLAVNLPATDFVQ